MRKPCTRTAALLAAALLATAAAGCGEKEESTRAQDQKVTLVLDYFPNADHAGIYAAEAAGEFDRAGIDLDIQTPPDPSAPLKLLAAGRADIAISYEPELLLARDKGLELVAVGALVQKPLTSIISLKPGIDEPGDLAGKRVGTAGLPYQSAYLKTIVSAAGGDPESVREINVGFNLSAAMLSRKVDATLGAFWNYEGTELDLKKRKPKIIRMEEAGVPTYNELILVARRDSLGQEGATVRRFLNAVARGYRSLRSDPDRAVDALLEANRDLERKLQTEVVKRTLPVFFPRRGLPWGWMEPREWVRYGRWMKENGLVEKDPAAARALTNEFLPGEGLPSDE